MKKSLLITSLLFINVLCSLSAGELVIIKGPERKTCGFLVKHKEKTYLYTSQTAIFGMKLIGVNYSFNAETLSGKKIATKGSMEVSPDRDVARIEVAGKFPDAFTIGNLSSIGAEISLYPEVMNKDAETLQDDKVTGLGVYSLAFETELENNAPGSPVLNEDGKVVGVISAWREKIVKVVIPAPPPKEEKKGKKKKGKPKPGRPTVLFQAELVKANLAGRISGDMEWVSANDSDFITASDAIHEAYTLQKGFLPLLNWWYKNPYRIVDSNVEFPKDLKKFVKYNNERARRIDVHIKKMRSNPKKYENLLKGVRDNCVHRAKLFHAFPKSQKAKMMAKWKTEFLEDQADFAAENWDFLLPFVKARLRSMEYRLPFNF